MNVGQKQVAGFPHNRNIVLDVEGELEIVLPVPAFITIIGQKRIAEKDFQAVEISSEPVENDDVRGNDKKVACKPGIRFVEFVEKAPRNEQAHHFGLAAAGGHFGDKP